MHPARFVSLLFAYAGVLLVVQAGFGSDWQLTLESVFLAGIGLVVFANAPIRMRQPIEKQVPSEYGLFVYALAALCLLLTVLTAVIGWPSLVR